MSYYPLYQFLKINALNKKSLFKDCGDFAVSMSTWPLYPCFRTPLHCAASCNNLPMVKFLVEHGACIFATTISDQETAAEKCEEDEDGYDGCSEYLYSE